MNNVIRLGDVCQVVSGSTPKTSIEEYWDGNIKWITPAELSEDSFYIHDTVKHISELGRTKTGLSYMPKGTVILSSRAPIGKVAIAGCEMCCNQGFKNLICSDKINNRYLFYYLKSKTAYLNSLGRGATFKEISKSIVENIKIPLPSIDEQIEIADKFACLERQLDLRKKQLKKLDELVKSRFVELFGDRFANDKQWDSKPLRDSADFYNGKAHEQVVDENGEYILVTSRCIASDVTDYRRTDELLFPLQINDIAMVMSDVPNGRALAKCILIDEDNKYTLNQRICCLRNYSFNPIFFYHLLNRHEYFLRFNDGNAQTNLRKDDLLDCDIIIPPIELQNQFAEFVEQTDKLKFEVKQALEKLETLKKSIMQQYFG